MWIPKNEIDHWVPLGNGEAAPVRKGQSDDEAKKAFIAEKENKKQSSKPQGKDRKASVADVDKTTVKQQVQASRDKLKGKKLVAEITGDKIITDYKTAAHALNKQLEKTGGTVTRESIGEIQVSARLKKARAYIKKPVEVAALAAVPAVIKHGIIIAHHEDHKGRAYESYTIAGNVKIGDKTSIVAVAVKKTTGNFYTIHRVLTPDGKEIDIEKTTD